MQERINAEKSEPVGREVRQPLTLRKAMPAILIGLSVLVIYGQSLWFGYVNYDDVLIRGKDWISQRQLSWSGLVRLFSFQGGGTFQPLRHLAFALVYQFSGLEPWGYHLFNIILYGFNLLAAFFLFRKLFELSQSLVEKREAHFWAFAATAWFAVHPVHVEAVAWMVSNKELLAGLFYFLSLLCYLKTREGRFFTLYYPASWIFLALGLLSKPSVAALPLVVVALELFYLPVDFSIRKVLLRTSVFIVLVLAAAFYYIFYTTAFTGSLLKDSLSVHILTMVSVLAKYVKILLFPVNLSNSYPPPFFSGEYNYRLFIYLTVDLVLFIGLVWSIWKKEKDIAFGTGFFLLNLLPISGLFPISIFMADRYLYLSSFGFVFVGVLVLIRFSRVIGGRRPERLFITGLSLAGLIFLTAISVERCQAWKDGVALWKSAVRTYPNFQFNHFGLGGALSQTGRYQEALDSYRKVNLFNENIKALYDMARIYEKMRDSLTADSCYRRIALLYDWKVDEPEIMAAVYKRLGMKENLARLLVEQGRSMKKYPLELQRIVKELLQLDYVNDALQVLREAAVSSPPEAGLKTALAELEIRLRDFDRALGTIREARSRREEPGKLSLLEADIEFARGNPRRALELYTSVSQDSLNAVRRERLAALYYSSGKLSQALVLFRNLARLAGQSEAAPHNNVGVVLEAMDSLEAAEKEYLQAVEIKPDYADAWFNLGNVARKKGKGELALQRYSRVRELEGISVDEEEARATALMALKRYDEAFQVYLSLARLDSTQSNALIGAANALWEQGRKELARQYYRHFLSRFGDANAPAYLKERALPDPTHGRKN